MDDILVEGDTVQILHERILALIQRCKEHNILLSKKKFKIAKADEKLKFAGFFVNSEGVSPDKDKCRTLAEFPQPQNVSDCRKFLGLCNQFTSFVPDLAMKTDAIRSLLKKNVDFLWSFAQAAEFRTLKKFLTSDLLIKQFDPSLKSTVYTDASRTGLGFLLVQTSPNGRKRLIQCGSRSLQPAEKRYAVIELELLGLVFALKKCHFYLFQTEFDVVVDHKPLLGIFQKHLPDIENMRLLRLRTKINEYNFTLKWIQGQENVIADVLSRTDFPDGNDQLDCQEIVHVNIVVAQKLASDPALENFFLAAMNDTDYCATVEMFQKGVSSRELKNLPNTHPARMYSTFWDNLSLHGPLLILNDRRIIVPASERTNVLKLLHKPHCGMSKTIANARQLYYWPGITNDIKNLVGNCIECQTLLPSQPNEELRLEKDINFPMQLVGIDLFSESNNTYLIMVDHYSGFPWCTRLKRTRTSDVLEHLNKWFTDFGFCARIRHDGAANLR